MRWLAARPRSASEPFFAWVHLFDPHDPYDPPADLKQRFASAPYDGEIAAVDRAVGTFVAAAGADTLVIVAADHGEALGGHGETTHGVFLYEESLHVPLVIRFPQGKAAGVRVTTRVRLADIAPTVLESIGMPVPREMHGQTLLPLVAPAATRDDRPVYAESAYPRRAFGWRPLVSWRSDRFLYCESAAPRVARPGQRPGCRPQLAGSRARVADGLDAELGRFLRENASGEAGAGGSMAAPHVDQEVAERLAALGYVGGSGGSPAASGVDPKHRGCEHAARGHPGD